MEGGREGKEACMYDMIICCTAHAHDLLLKIFKSWGLR